MVATSRFTYKAGVSFMNLENVARETISLPVYLVLLNEDLLTSLPTKTLRYTEELKLETRHGLRRFRAWFSQSAEHPLVRIEECLNDEWLVVHAYRPL